MKIKYFLVTLAIMSTAFYSAVLFFSPGTVQWNGSADTDWNNASNWTVLSGSPSIPPNKGETGDHVVITNGVPNFPEIIAPAFARSLTINAGAKVTVKSGHTLKVIGSDLDGVTNDGLIIVEPGGVFEIDSAFDDGLINHLGAKVVNNGSISIQNGNGSRVENADSIINNAGANFNVYLGLDTALINFKTGVIKNFATFNVLGGSNAQVSNYGKIINETGIFSVSGGLGGTIFTNQLTGYLFNAGTFSSGSGNNGIRLDNYSTIDNHGIFSINGAALGKGFINRSNAIFNHLAGTCTISSGKDMQLDNSGQVNLSSTTNIIGGFFPKTILNNSGARINQLGGTLTIQGGEGTEIDNNGVINIHSNTQVSGGGGMNMPNILNGIGDTINHFAGTFNISSGNYTELDNSGVVNLYAATTINGGGNMSIAVKNNATGIINNFSGLLTIQYGSAEKLVNDGNVYLNDDVYFGNGPTGILINNSGAKFHHANGNMTIQSFASNPGFKNDGNFYGGIANNIVISNGGGPGLVNNGTFIDTTGGSFSWTSLAGDVINNTNYFFMDEPILQSSNAGTSGWLINNSDSAIFGPNTLITSMFIGKFVNNSANAYLENNGAWLFSYGTSPIINAGNIYFSPTSSMKGQKVGGNIITNTGRFIQEGNIVFREFAGSILQNDNFFMNTGTLQSSDWQTSLTNNDTIINKGIIDLDTIGNNAIVNNSYFFNDTSGKVYGDFLGTNGIFNSIGAKIKNAGEIWMAKDTGIALFGISNSGTFDNSALINIGKKGPLFGGGIENTSSGIFNNIDNGEIFIYNLVKSPSIPYGIKNDGNFNNSCSYIETQGPILDNNNFVNSGIIYKVPDTITANSNIAVNNKYVFNGDVDPFNIGSNNGRLFNTNCGTAVPTDQLLALLTECDPIDCSLYTSGKIYVDSSATGANNGNNWTDAFNSLQDALSHARSCSVDTILVAKGTYYPSEPILVACGDKFGLDSTISFNIPDSMVILGGYPTGGGTLNLSSIDDPLRDPLCNKTILSGDIQQDGNLANNSYHVLTTFAVSNATIIDGFCITQGNAVFLDQQGFPTLRNVGGGLLNSAFDPISLDDMALPGVSNPRILNCTFYDNHALIGAGLANLGIAGTASPDIIDCNFYSDSAILGGGIANLGYDGESSPNIIRAKIQANTGLAAGGVLNLSGSIGSFIIPNPPLAPIHGALRSTSIPTDLKDAFGKSGIMQLIDGMSSHMPHMTSTNIPGTAASTFPVMIPGFGVVSPYIKNSLITGNAALAGGGIVNYVLNFNQEGGGETSPKMINTTIASNGANQGGGMINGDEGFVNDENTLVHPCLVNSILVSNAAVITGTEDMFNEFNGTTPYADTIKIHHSIIGGSYADLASNVSSPHSIDTSLSSNKFETDPLFVNAPFGLDAPTNAGNFHLQGGSPAINMGDNNSCPEAIDLDHKQRIYRGIIDVGAYEMILNCDSLTLYVAADGSVPNVPYDSLTIPLSPSCNFYINGILNTTGIQPQCTDTGVHNYSLIITTIKCAAPDTLSQCIKVITLLDTFTKHLTTAQNINVSLGELCTEVLTAHELLANFGGCNINYDVTISYPAGTNTYPSGDILDRSHLGYCMIVSVTETTTGNKTWGRICVEDKKPPQLNCDIIDTVTCFEYGNLPKGSYEIADNCGPPVKVNVIGETYTDYGCDSAVLQGVVTRQLVARDQWGNSVNCIKTFHIIKLDLDSVVCVRDTMVDCSKEIIELTIDGVKKKVSILDPIRSGYPTIKTAKGIKKLGLNNSACKMTVSYKDERLGLCGNSYKVFRTWLIADWCTGEEKFCYQYISVVDITAPVVTIKVLADISSTPHDCGQFINLDTLKVTDCNKVKQTYFLKYDDEGITRVVNGTLPASRIWLPIGQHIIDVQLLDACGNESRGTIRVNIIDNTPPTPVCDEYTQVTVDPATCWAAVAAKDLDNGSRDNCDKPLHFAAALMTDIEKARKDYEKRIVDSCGNTEYWANKPWYDAEIERWINCYVFKDSVQLDECGTQQVVLRVYEADQLPRLDPHLWTCGEHAWFCYNTDAKYRLTHNWNFFRTSPAPSFNCYASSPWLCQVASDTWFASRSAFSDAASIYYGSLPTADLRRRLYSDCMVNVLVDDKQAPVVADLTDITIYCDGANGNYNLNGAPGAPDYADAPDCGRGDVYPGVDGWPLDIKDSKGVIHGYYGGSDYLGLHVTAGEHEDPQACQPSIGWAPIYCRSWLLVDSFDQAGHINPKDYFDKLILFDKTRPTKAIKGNEFSITDNCRLDDASLKVTDNGTLNSCGEGWIQRTWTIKDKCGNAVTATQKIIVKHRSDFEVIFPEDKIVTCDFLNRTDTSRNGAGRPTISDDECEQIGVRYTDEIFTVEDSACYKIVRTWTLIDWCIYDANQHNHAPDVIVNDSLRANNKDRSCVYRNIKDNNDGFMQYVQIIKVIDELAPVVTCSDQTVCINSGCSTTVNIPLNGTDNCADEVIFRVDITKPDGTHDLRSNIKSVTGSYTEGIYKIKIIGKDRCGNEDTCDMVLTIKDCKKPTPYCINGVATVVMPSTGAVTVWAKDLNLNSEDNCTPKDQLRYSFTADTTTSSRIMNCADLSSNGQLQIIPVDIYVTDNAGNQDLCKTYIQLQDNADVAGGRPQGACKDTVASIAGVISGRLQTEGHEGVESAVVELKGETNPGIPSFKSGIDGSYQFNALPVEGKYTIKALRDDQPMNGVSTLDLVLIQKHILGTESFKSPYKIIAADADNNNDVSVIDLIELRKLILGIYDKLPNNTSWKFVPKSYAFSNALSPWGYATEETVDAKERAQVKDFVGIKIGDVNATAAAHSLMGTEIRSGATGLIFEVEDRVFKAGDRVEVSFKSPNFKGITGFQGTIQITNNELRITNELNRQSSIVNSKNNPYSLNMTDKNIGTRWSSEGLITMSWNTNTSIDVKEDDILFTMTFVANSSGRLSEVLRIGSQHTKAESYEGKGELGNLSLRFIDKSGQLVAGKSELYQNYPNPFDRRTVIGVNLAEEGRGTLKITDITGRVIKRIEKEWMEGYHEIWLDRREIQASGVLYYSFEGTTFRAVKKMVIIE